MSDTLQELLDTHVDSGLLPGAVALLGRGGDVQVVTAGRMSIDGPPMPADAIMRIQSMTKPVTTVAALLQVQAGRLDLDDDVGRWLPELADPRGLRRPDAELDDTEPVGPIRVRHLLTNTSGYGMNFADTPLTRAMRELQVDAGPEPPVLDSGEWLRRLGGLPLAGPPGQVFRYHHSLAILGILLQRLADQPLDDHLRAAVFEPLGMVDTGLWVPEAAAHRLPAAYRPQEAGLLETEPLAGGFYAGPPPHDMAHGELVSTASDFHRLARVLADGGRHEGQRFLDPALVAAMTSDQVDPVVKTSDSFFPGFWDGVGWGFGVCVHTEGPHRGRYGWAGGQGTDWFTDPDGTIAVLLTQVELGEAMSVVLEEFQELR